MIGLSLATAGVLAAALQSPAAPSPIWQTDIQQAIVSFAAAANGQCVAVATRANSLVMIGATGQVAWQAPLVEAADPNGLTAALAASPTCDWAAVVTRSGRVQLIDRRGTSVAADFGDRARAIDNATFWPRSMQIAPDGSALVIGTERDWLFLVSRTGAVKAWRAGDTDQPIAAEFSTDGTRLIVTGLWTTGVMNLDGTWHWRQSVSHFRISASRDLSRFAAFFTPAHGPSAGSVAILDARGMVTWSRTAHEPGAAMAPDGSFVAYTGMTELRIPATDEPIKLYVADPSGRTLAERQIRGNVESITPDGCVLVHEREGADGPYDLVARDKTLKEVWRLPAKSLPHNQTRLSAPLLFVHRESSLVAFRLPSCR